ncbi:unnamed protein product [Ambrosiozyma monospora]|uniref:Unnamed protein product n=1 Tax=Ambrosiozyma monospora TaxID=43982 RepID=A0A9W6Z619_AMBMO|nr:unnamed protein product [Ambrosiozyma monospora]
MNTVISYTTTDEHGETVTSSVPCITTTDEHGDVITTTIPCPGPNCHESTEPAPPPITPVTYSSYTTTDEHGETVTSSVPCITTTDEHGNVITTTIPCPGPNCDQSTEPAPAPISPVTYSTYTTTDQHGEVVTSSVPCITTTDDHGIIVTTPVPESPASPESPVSPATPQSSESASPEAQAHGTVTASESFINTVVPTYPGSVMTYEASGYKLSAISNVAATVIGFFFMVFA